MSNLLRIDDAANLTLGTVVQPIPNIAFHDKNLNIVDTVNNVVLDLKTMADNVNYYDKTGFDTKVNDIVANSLTPKPITTNAPINVNENSTSRIIFDNYIAGTIYSVTSDIGIPTITSGVNYIDITFNEVTIDTAGTVIITAQEGTMVPSVELFLNITVINVPITVDQLISTSDFLANASSTTNITL